MSGPFDWEQTDRDIRRQMEVPTRVYKMAPDEYYVEWTFWNVWLEVDILSDGAEPSEVLDNDGHPAGRDYMDVFLGDAELVYPPPPLVVSAAREWLRATGRG